MLIDVAALRTQWEQRGVDPEQAHIYGPGDDAQKHTAELRAAGTVR
jgi:hypothetical protein